MITLPLVTNSSQFIIERLGHWDSSNERLTTLNILIYHFFVQDARPSVAHTVLLFHNFVTLLQMYIDKSKGIQRKLLRYFAFNSGNPMSYTDHDYSNFYTWFKLASIYQIHFQADAVGAFKVIHHIINSPDTFDLFTTRVFITTFDILSSSLFH